MEDCLLCEFKTKCEAKFGRIGIDKEDCTAIAGTHFCFASWEQFYKDLKNKKGVK